MDTEFIDRNENALRSAEDRRPAYDGLLSARERELLEGMIEVQINHANRCDAIANRAMAEKQKGWDMERVALLRKILAHGA